MNTKFYAVKMSVVEVDEKGNEVAGTKVSILSDVATSDAVVAAIAMQRASGDVSRSVEETEGHMHGGETLIYFTDDGEEVENSEITKQY
jgi:hypothetical protein